MSEQIDVLAVIRRHAKSHRAMAETDAYSAQEAPRLEAALSVVAELIEAHKRIAALDPETDSKDGFNEWGEAECFGKAQEISRAALARVGGAE